MFEAITVNNYLNYYLLNCHQFWGPYKTCSGLLWHALRVFKGKLHALYIFLDSPWPTESQSAVVLKIRALSLSTLYLRQTDKPTLWSNRWPKSTLSIYFRIPHDPLSHNQLLFWKSDHFHFLRSIYVKPISQRSEATVDQSPCSLYIFGFPMTHWVTISCCFENPSTFTFYTLFTSNW